MCIFDYDFNTGLTNDLINRIKKELKKERNKVLKMPS